MGVVFNVLTFPGVIIHELAHQLFCFICRIPVYEIKYFQFQNPNGYVIRERTDSPWKNFLISMGPFFINTIIGICLLLTVTIENNLFGVSYNMLNNVVYWLGISMLVQSFPSAEDIGILVEGIIKNKEVNVLGKIIVAPFIFFAYVGVIGSVFWLDVAYALLIAYQLPNIIALFIS